MRFFKKILGCHGILTLLLFCLSSTVWAADPVDYGELELDTSYDFVTYQTVRGRYTAEADGVLTVTCSSSEFPTPYSDEDYSEKIDFTLLYATGDVYYVYYYLDVTEGQTIYFQKSFCMSSSSFTLSFAQEQTLTLKGVSPTEGSMIVCTETTQISFNFNMPVSISNAEVQVGETTVELTPTINTSNVFFNITDDFYALLSDGTLNDGDEFTIRINGLHSSSNSELIYGEDGICEASFVSGPKPVALVSTENIEGNTFRSYWSAGDETGILKLTFDGEIAENENTSATLRYGDTSSETSSMYTETLALTFSGNQIIIDLTDKERTPQTMLGSNTIYETILLKVASVYGANGYPAYSEGSGTVGSYSYTMDYGLTAVNISTEFTPASGSSLSDVEEIELWTTDYENIYFDAILFTYENEAGEVVSLVSTDYTATADEDIEGAYIILIAVPEEIREMSNVEVTLQNLIVADGNDYTYAFTAKYNGLVIKKATYKEDDESASVSLPGNTIDQFAAGSTVKIVTNMDDEIGYMRFFLHDFESSESEISTLLTSGEVEYDETNGFHFEVEEIIKFYTGHTYELEVVAYASEEDYTNSGTSLGSDEVPIYGSSEEYEYSSTTLESIEPEDYIIASPDEFQIVLTYSGLVILYEDLTCLVAGEQTYPFAFEGFEIDEDGMAYKWTLSLDAETAAAIEDSLVTVNVYAIDQNFLVVQGNKGIEEDSYLSFDLTLAYNLSDEEDEGDSSEEGDEETGIVSVSNYEALTENTPVYTLNGICISKTSSTSTRRSLASGIYIVGGRKVVVK